MHIWRSPFVLLGSTSFANSDSPFTNNANMLSGETLAGAHFPPKPSFNDDSCGQGPVANMDVTGLGVRISFYAQTLIYALLVITSRDQALESLWTLVMYTSVYSTITLILGFKAHPQLTLHDAVVIMYLLSLSWTTLYLTIATFWHLRRRILLFETVFFGHTILLLSCELAILISAKSFGSLPECNSSAVMFFFREFHVLRTGQMAGFILLIVQLVGFLSITLYDYGIFKRRSEIIGLISRMFRRERGEGEGIEVGTRDVTQRRIADRPVVIRRGSHHAPQIESQASRPEKITNICVLIVVWLLLVVFTELTIIRNHFMNMGQFAWGVGQISAMSLLIVPINGLRKALVERYRISHSHPSLVGIPGSLRPDLNGRDDRQEQHLGAVQQEQGFEDDRLEQQLPGDGRQNLQSPGDDEANSPTSASHEGAALQRSEVTLSSSSSRSNSLDARQEQGSTCQPSTTEPVEPVESPRLTPLPASQRLHGQEIQESLRTSGMVEALDQGTTEVTAYDRSEEIAAHHKMQEPCLLATDDQTESKGFNEPSKATQEVTRDSTSDENTTNGFPGRASNRLPTEPRSGPSRGTSDSSLLAPLEERVPNMAGDGVEEGQMKSKVPRRDNEGDARSIRDTQDEDMSDDPPGLIITPSSAQANQTQFTSRRFEASDWLPHELEEHRAPIKQGDVVPLSEVNEAVQQMRMMPASPCSDPCSPRSSTTTFFTAPEE
ncbi:hypothetical protein ACEPAG_5787 [Sanghuangporus baumii]